MKKKITIIFMSVLMIFASCSTDIPYDDINENTETVEEPKEDNSKNNTEEPSNEEPKEDDTENNTEEPSNEEDDTENDNDEKGNFENTETVEESNEDDTKNNTEEPSNEEDDTEIEDEPLNEEPNEEDNSENDNDEKGNSENTETVEDEPLNEDDTENEDIENKTWCEIGEDTKILGLNYFVCVDNSQTKLSPSINDESQAKKDTFLIRDYVDCVSKYIEIRVGYNDKKLKFSSVSDSYIITDVMKKDSTINITIEWK